MKNQLRILLFICMYAFGVAAFAQLDKKAQSTLKRATGKLDNAEKTFTAGKEMFDDVLSTNSINKFTVERSEKKTTDAEAKAKEADEILSTLDASAPEVKEAKARITKILADATAERKRYKEALDKLNGADTLWESADTEAMKSLQKKLDGYASEVRASRKDKTVLDSWPQLSKDAEAIFATYKGVKATSTKARFVELEFTKLQDLYDNANKTRADALQSIPTQIEESLARANKFAQEAIDKGTFGQFIHVVEPELAEIEGCLTVYAAISTGAAGADTKLIEKTRAKLDELNALQKKHEAKIIETNKAPEDPYQGADRAKLTSLVTTEVQAANKGQKVLAVKIVESEWRRLTGEKWNASSLTWEKYDESHLNVAALVSSPDGKYAYIYRMTLSKKHMANDKIIVTYYSISGKPTMPSDILLISNAK